ncbi:hypothetical protein HanXRQr2_Chr06g0252001 [Helianthus annuus]|uniref:Uncharacterized protein n=1 Tax=Helianthus annuus TaxID=4232 RepID=A0A9K3IS87_HELAN|nr:hypothetical protein HanXRQr2_Chr06g0252001 [Helianthus annuus]
MYETIYLEPKGIDNVDHLHCLIINTFIVIGSFSRRVCANVNSHCSLYHPLQIHINVLC